ncbi:MAG: hypothetical protein ABJG68_01665 [Crocinitomicaceae bacterium]
MNKYAKISILVGVVIAFIVLLYVFGGKSKPKEDYVSDNWYETYSPEDKGPYGTFVMRQLLDTVNMFGNFVDVNKPLEEDLLDNEDLNDIYFFIGKTNFMEDSTAEFLMDFVANGNTAFMSASSFPYRICEELFYNPDDLYEYYNDMDSMAYFRFLHPDLSAKRYKFKYINNNEGKEKYWNTFDTSNVDDYNTRLINLAVNTKGQSHFIKLPYGDGFFYFHSVPYCFTNVSMLKREGFQYAEHMLEHIPPGRVQWDRYNLEAHYNYSDFDGEGGEDRKSIIDFILQNPPLAWAMFILIIGGILYALFKGKRRQDIIAATEQKDNTSMQYVQTLSSLYMQKGTHSKLIRLKEKTFLNFIAERYYIITNVPDALFFEKVAVKSQIEKNYIAEIFATFNELESAFEVSDDELISLHQKIEYFYKNCR